MRGAIGLVVAMGAEARALAGGGPWDHSGPFPCRRSRLDESADLLTVRSGMGWKNARAAAQWLIQEGIAALGVAGISGGLAPWLVSGDLVLADKVLQEAEGCVRPVWGGDTGFVRGVCRALKQAGLCAYAGPIVTVQRPVFSRQEKESLFRRSGALIVDMESAAVAEAAGEVSRPFFAFRAVCDAAGRSLPPRLFDSISQGGRIRPVFLIQQLLLRPALFGDLFWMTRDFCASLRTLREGWHRQMKTWAASLLPA